ncbi:hypothetical protein, partial [Streptomyces sp. NPDC086023]|uniref:hypothetical protein n=1 Tax=Streptomyces sp. NPDC086023 TaxID=3365746 RepID=UPI0037D46972
TPTKIQQPHPLKRGNRMRYTRTALTIATTLLALTTLGGTTAHANNEKDKDEDGKSNICFIHVEGNHNHNACGDIKYGDNATTGNSHTLTVSAEPLLARLTVTNGTGSNLAWSCPSCQGPYKTGYVTPGAAPFEFVQPFGSTASFFTIPGGNEVRVVINPIGVPSCQFPSSGALNCAINGTDVEIS